MYPTLEAESSAHGLHLGESAQGVRRLVRLEDLALTLALHRGQTKAAARRTVCEALEGWEAVGRPLQVFRLRPGLTAFELRQKPLSETWQEGDSIPYGFDVATEPVCSGFEDLGCASPSNSAQRKRLIWMGKVPEPMEFADTLIVQLDLAEAWEWFSDWDCGMQSEAQLHELMADASDWRRVDRLAITRELAAALWPELFVAVGQAVAAPAAPDENEVASTPEPDAGEWRPGQRKGLPAKEQLEHEWRELHAEHGKRATGRLAKRHGVNRSTIQRRLKDLLGKSKPANPWTLEVPKAKRA